MAKKIASLAPPKPYEVRIMCLQRVINSPAAQRAKTVLLERLESYPDDAWEQVMAN